MVPEEDARLFIDALIHADLRGVDTHGLRFLPIYVKRLELGLIARNGSLKILREGLSFALIDGNNLLGHVVAHKAMEIAIQKAHASGLAAVGVRNSNHCGMMAHYTLLAAEASCIGIALSNTPPLMAPWGGATALLGTNPLSIAVPGGEGHSIVLDMATSEVARAKIIAASQRKEKIPTTWGLDPAGIPTDDPDEALKGTVSPMSKHKGSGAAMMIDILCALLTGAASLNEVGDLLSFTESDKQNLGHFFQAIHIEHFVSLKEFRRRIDRFVRAIRTSRLASGVEKIRLPGDRSRETEEERKKRGIPLSVSLRAQLKELGDKYGVPLPF
jgi:LDH2 family malate/lactate/ureidoglycolate dehydrogenase